VSSAPRHVKYLRKINNFNTLMGIIAGLNTASVNRLKAIKTDMAKKLLTVPFSSLCHVHVCLELPGDDSHSAM
jgi:hypothetical protein